MRRLCKAALTPLIFASLLAFMQLNEFIISINALEEEQSQQQTRSLSKKLDCHPVDKATKESCEKLGCIWQPVESNDRSVSSQGVFGDLNANKSANEIESTSQTGWDFAGDSPKPDVREPWCYFPENYVGYEIVDVSESNDEITLRRTRPSGLPSDIGVVKVSIKPYNKALRLRIWDPQVTRFEPEIPKLNLVEESIESATTTGNDEKAQRKQQPAFNIHVDRKKGLLQITRPNTNELIFRTDLRRLIFSDKFHQLNTDLSSEFVFGLGEHYDTFVKRASKDYKAYSYYATDKLPLPEGRRSYGSFPFYVNLELDNDGDKLSDKAHGVYLRNSNGMEIILQPDTSITFRPIGGILDFLIFSGPSSGDVVKQYQQIVGLPDLPPRWALGYHLCRYNYGSMEKLFQVWNRTRASGIPFDVQWTDIDTMDNGNDFTYDKQLFKGLPDFVDHLHSLNMHYVPILDPGVSQEANYRPYELGMQLDAFVKNSTDEYLIGKVWNRSNRTVYVDFSGSGGRKMWQKLFEEFHQVIKFDGAWIDMNEVSNFVDGSLDGCPNNQVEPYSPGGYDITTKTMCPDAKHSAGRDYDIHNIYAFYEAIATRDALLTARPGKRPFVISRASSPGQGHFSGHWSGDILSSWDYLRWTIPSSIEHAMYGFNMMGHDICGFIGDTNAELCARWQALGSFYTFSRNHNDAHPKDQDPVIMGPDVLEATRNALTKRYSLLPFLYTLIHRAHRYGEPAIRSTALEFGHREPAALEAEMQMMWADKIIISPVVEQGSTKKDTYLPRGRWFEFNVLPVENANSIQAPQRIIDSQGQWVETNDISLRDIPLFIQAGSIIPVYRQVKQTIPETVAQPFGLDVFLSPDNRAIGELFVDDGDSNETDKYNHLSMIFAHRRLRIELNQDVYEKETKFGQVIIYSIPFEISSVKANGKQISFAIKEGNSLVFDLDGLSVSRQNPIEVELVSNKFEED